MTTESELIDASLGGNSAAFGELVRIHQDRLFHAVTHFIGDATEAEDVVQEAFVQAYLKLDSFQRTSAFYTWLYRIAFNTAVSRQRRKRVTTSVDQVRDQAGDEPIDRGGTPDLPLTQQETVSQIQAALAAISEEHRQILILREMEELEYEEISQVLDINVGTVRSRLHRARLALREVLERSGGADA